MQRDYCYEESVMIDTVVADATAIDLRNYAGGSVSIPSGSSVTTITVYGCHTVDGTYLAAYDNADAAVTLTVAASRCVQLPDAVFGYPFIKLVGDADGTCTLFLKS
jgi:hypothetical protein